MQRVAAATSPLARQVLRASAPVMTRPLSTTASPSTLNFELPSLELAEDWQTKHPQLPSAKRGFAWAIPEGMRCAFQLPNFWQVYTGEGQVLGMDAVRLYTRPKPSNKKTTDAEVCFDGVAYKAPLATEVVAEATAERLARFFISLHFRRYGGDNPGEEADIQMLESWKACPSDTVHVYGVEYLVPSGHDMVQGCLQTIVNMEEDYMYELGFSCPQKAWRYSWSKFGSHIMDNAVVSF